ncbi:MAG: peptidoglycan-binding protein [Pseudomonadota bacterium]
MSGTIGLRTLAVMAFSVSAVTLPTVAFSAADLVINRADSTIRPGSCETGAPLVSGRIAIKNQGEDAAALGVTQRFARSMLAVYVPENIDMIDKRTEREKLDPFDQEGVEFELGAGILKKGRTFGRPSTNEVRQSFSTNVALAGRSRSLAIQRSLDKIGFDPGGIDGIIGRNTRSAIRDYQRDIGAVATGTLTESQENVLFQKAGVSVDSVGLNTGAQGPTTVTVYAVVDPYNLIAEEDEANNIWAFEFEVDCGQ